MENGNIFLKSFIIGVIIALILPSFSYAGSLQTDLSLEDAIRIGIESSQQLEINKLNIEKAKVGKGQARSQERKYSRSKDLIKQLNQAGIETPSIGGTLESFMLEEELSSLGAKYDQEEEELKTDAIKKDVTNNITNTYYKTLMARDNVNIAEETLANVQESYNVVKKKYDVGTESKSKLYFEEIALNDAKIELDKTEDLYKQAIRGLNFLIDYPLTTELNLISSYSENDSSINLDEDLNYAYSNRYDYLVLKNTQDLAVKNFDIVKGSYTPNTYKYRETAVDVTKINTFVRDIEQMIEADIRSNHDTIVSSKKEIALMDANIQKAEEGLRLAKLTYELETGTSLEVNEAITTLSQAKLGRAKAIADYNLALLNYDKSVNIGNLD